MKLTFATAKKSNALAIALLRTAVAQHLTDQYGRGPWSGAVTEKGVLFFMKTSQVLVARSGGKLIATLSLSTRKPWSIDRSYFAKAEKPLYLTNMAVTPVKQRKGIGRRMLKEAIAIARKWPSDAICLDAYDADAGGGPFYAKCGFREVGRTTYRKAPLVYFEMML